MIAMSTIMLFLAVSGFFWFLSEWTHPTVDEHPVYWMSNHQLVLMTKNDLILRDITAKNPDKVIFAMPEEFRETDTLSKSSCFSQSVWRIYWWRANGSSRSSNTANFEIHISDHAVSKVRKLEATLSKAVNSHDCTLVPLFGSEITLASPKENHPAIKTRINYTTLSLRDAQNVKVAKDFGQTILAYENDRGSQRVLLPRSKEYPNGWDRVVRASDGARYLFFPLGGDFSATPEKWPMDVWVVDVGQAKAKQIALPMGPWVNDYGEKLRCFSCGCGCYRQLDLFLIGTKIYGHVSGIGYPKRVEGIYVIHLDQEKQTWEKIIDGSVEKPITFSPDGCKLAFVSSELTIAELCTPKNLQ